MQIVTVAFNSDLGNSYDYLLLKDVFKKSCEIHMPDVEFIEYLMEPSKKDAGRAYNFTYNSDKLKIWMDHMEQADQDVIFADCDMLCVKPAYHAFDKPFDIAYTARTVVQRIPMNGGIVFARPTEGARRFFREWYRLNMILYKNPGKHQPYRERWAGMNQSAFGCMMENMDKYNFNIHKYYTREWNAVDTDWGKIDQDTVFIHYKSALRKLVLRKCPPTAKYKTAIMEWNKVREMI